MKKENTGIPAAGFRLFFILLTGFGLAVSTAAAAGTSVGETVSATIAVQKKTDKSRIEWKDEKEKCQAEYENLLAEKDFLEKRENRLIRKTKTVRESIAEHKRRLMEMARVSEGIESYLENVLVFLKAFIAEDLPFLQEERKNRLVYLEESLADTNLTPGEKYRRVMEAVEIEADYGSTVESYDEIVLIDGRKTAVDILRLGRLSLFFLAKNGKASGFYNPAEKKWAFLDSSETKQIANCIEMARQQRTIDFVSLPIGAIAVK